MKILRKIAISAALLFVGTLYIFASVNDLPTVQKDGALYHYYEVQPKETIYSLSKKLGISKDEIIKYNPSVVSGLKANSILYFPATMTMAITHVVKKGDTIYGIARQYGVKPDQLLAMNPEAAKGLRIGQTIKISEPTPAPAVAAAPVPTPAPAPTPAQPATPVNIAPPTVQTTTVTHTVKAGETLYGIAQAYGIDVPTLEAANPRVGIIQPGQVLNIPQPTTTAVIENPANGAVATDVVTPVSATVTTVPTEAVSAPSDQPLSEMYASTDTVPENVASAVGSDNAEIRIGLLFPFMSKTQGQKKEAKAQKEERGYLEFYQGFLLAVDSLRNSYTPLKIYAFDTHGSTDSVAAILSRPEVAALQVIVAPKDDETLLALDRFSKDNKVYVLNPFSVNDSLYMTNPRMMLGNIPSENLKRKAVTAFADNLGNRVPVFVSREGGETDKLDFVELVKEELGIRSIPFKEIIYKNTFDQANLKALDPAGDYVFIPVSGKHDEVSKLFPTLTRYKEGQLTAGGDSRLFGYPEWIVFKGKTADNIRKMDATIYSRFFYAEDDSRIKEIERLFDFWYKHHMGSEKPKNALLGFDTGMFLINALIRTNGDLERAIPNYGGVQNIYEFTSPVGIDGYVNDALYLINFRPSGLTESQSIW